VCRVYCVYVNLIFRLQISRRDNKNPPRIINLPVGPNIEAKEETAGNSETDRSQVGSGRVYHASHAPYGSVNAVQTPTRHCRLHRYVGMRWMLEKKMVGWLATRPGTVLIASGSGPKGK